MRGLRSAVLSVTAVAVVAGLLFAAPLPVSATAASVPGITGHAYPGDSAKEPAIVAAEQRRIYSIRAITSAVRWREISAAVPYRVSVARKSTLVLVARSQPYLLADLRELIPDALVQQPDGSFLLSNDIVVQTGATLKIDDPDGLVIHLASSATGFNSILSLGGVLSIAGSKKAPVRINAWDASKGTLDNNTADGRAYVRAMGGSANFSYATFDHLGFWSGVTGGVSLTGTNTATSDIVAAGLPPVGSASSQGKSRVHGAVVEATATPADVAAAVDSADGGYSYVTALISHVTSEDNAYGLFVNGSTGVKVADSEFSNNLVDGIVLHRSVTNSTITSTTTHDNAVDGFAMTRAATGIVVNQLTATRNGRDGISLNGSPLANGPSATGAAVGSYGNNVLSNSVASDNSRYGIVVLGGDNVQVTGNTVTSNLMGIVVNRAATKVSVRSNVVDKSAKHGIALLDGVSKSVVSENSVSGAATGIYLRDSSAAINRNTVSGATLHGVTVIGSESVATVVGNTLSGSGSTAIDHSRAGTVDVGENDLSNWTSTRSFATMLRSFFQPLTVLWLFLGMLLLVAAIGGIGRKRTGIRHPYANHVPLTALSKGIVNPEEVAAAPVHARTHRSVVDDAGRISSADEPSRPARGTGASSYGMS